MDTLQFNDRSSAIIDLQERGYEMDFVLRNEFILCVQDSELISPDDFEIIESYLFEDAEYPDENFVIFAVYANHTGLKGILMASCSAFYSGLSIHLWSRIAGKIKALPACNAN